MQASATTCESLGEHAGYFSVPGAHLHTVLHQVTQPIARVLLIGPFASERQFSYDSCVRWARYLAARGYEVARYDYRGIGESTGSFEDMSFADWDEDVALLADWFLKRSPDVPLLLHGIELGAILAGRIFSRATGNALLMWSPPANANQALRAILRRWAGLEQLYDSPENRKSASEYIRELGQGTSIEVHGYQWSSRLWRESFHFELPSGIGEQTRTDDFRQRPVRAVKFGNTADALVMPYRRFEEQDLSALFSSTCEWLAEALAQQPARPNAEEY